MTADRPFRPMLADNKFNLEEHGKDLHFPAYLSPKLDGIRVVLHPELGAVTRNLKPVRNIYARETLNAIMEKHPETVWLDGEIIVGDPTAPNAYNATSSGIQSFKGEPDFQFHVFDKYHPEKPFRERYRDALDIVSKDREKFPHFKMVWHDICTSIESLGEKEEHFVGLGYEGTMYRHPEGLYKQGRSTLKQQWLLKVKRWVDCEGEVIGFKERLINGNEQTVSETGYAQRSSHQENMVPSGLLGAYRVLILNGEFKGKECDVSPAFHTHGMLKEVWDDQWGHMFKTMTFSHFPHGSKDLPRFPKFLRWRDDGA